MSVQNNEPKLPAHEVAIYLLGGYQDGANREACTANILLIRSRVSR